MLFRFFKIVLALLVIGASTIITSASATTTGNISSMQKRQNLGETLTCVLLLKPNTPENPLQFDEFKIGKLSNGFQASKFGPCQRNPDIDNYRHRPSIETGDKRKRNLCMSLSRFPLFTFLIVNISNQFYQDDHTANADGTYTINVQLSTSHQTAAQTISIINSWVGNTLFGILRNWLVERASCVPGASAVEL
ncbi:hypothetical protein GALMADRAFT_919612 [Galerina marginata CBS 339.88]|uniref:Secreted protein n=1 Tax=Galerina marginata (strain CBS 339.88) TaxID=685588 RepID=A0A067SHD0_GALM3|nr:hypothetical protein GALMADRAFT_919612 [Galerina marginata CBS 339.88]